MKFFIAVIIAIFCLAICTKSAHAETLSYKDLGVVFSDDFSHSLDKWELARGDPNVWSKTNNLAVASIATSNTLSELVPRDQYWDSSIKNLAFDFDYTPILGTDRNIGFGYQDPQNWSEIHFTNREYNLVRVKDGGIVMNIFRPYDLLNGQEYHFKILLLEGHIQVWLNAEQIVNEVDPSFNHNYGKITLKATTGDSYPTKVGFTNVVVHAIAPVDGKRLNVPLFKQNDPLWKNVEYDQAHAWSDKPTIRRWGCALTSLAMMMKYYSLDKMPDGAATTPATLNEWLKSQHDGFFSGAVNWIAFTRLVRILHELLGTTKLEYARINGPNMSAVKSEITADRPVVLQLPGHFLVADGVLPDNSILIKDPIYPFSKLSQHKEPVLSVRTFTPSHTDLSYILLVHQPNLLVKVKDTQGNILPTLQSFYDEVDDSEDSSGEKTPPLVEDQIAKPAEGKYIVEVSQDTLDAYSLQIVTYDKAANPTFFTETGEAGPQSQHMTLDYHYDQTSSVTNQNSMNFTQFRKDLQTAKTVGQILRMSTFLRLDRIVAFAEKATSEEQKRYVGLLKILVKRYSAFISVAGEIFLNKKLDQLAKMI